MSTIKPSSKPSTTKRAIQLVALFFILVVLPLGTLYYTSSGHEYYKEMISEFHEYGTVPSFTFTTHDGQPFTREDLEGKLVVSGFFTLNNDDAALLGQQVKKVHQHFNDRNEVLFLLHTLDPEHDTPDRLKAFAQEMALTDEKQCYLLTGPEGAVREYLSKGYQWPEDYGKTDRSVPLQLGKVPSGTSRYPYLVLADTAGVIRNYYAYADNAAMGRLVEHLALLVPSRGNNKPELRREVEK